MDELRDSLDLSTGEMWPVPHGDSEAGVLVGERSELLVPDATTSPPPTEKIPWDFGTGTRGDWKEIVDRFVRERPEVAAAGGGKNPKRKIHDALRAYREDEGCSSGAVPCGGCESA